jgi:hypothetical protein
LLQKELVRKLLPGASDKDRDELAKRQAHAAVALFQLDQLDGEIWLMLRHGADPRVRDHLIHRLSRVGLKPHILIGQYRVEKDPGAKEALLVSLGKFDDAQLLPQRRQELVPELLAEYRTNAEAVVHAALGELLRRWGQEKELRRIDKELKGPAPSERRSSGLNRQSLASVLVYAWPGHAGDVCKKPPAAPDTNRST